MARQNQPPPDNQADQRVARSRPAGVGHVTFGQTAARLLDNGYGPIPIRPGRKVPALTRWTTVTIDSAAVDAWSRSYADHGIGLRTGHLIGLDIDILDPDLAHDVCRKAEDRFGETLMRVGLWPKRMLIYRTDQPFAKLKVPGIEVLGAGQQFVAFGIHPDTGQAYSWPMGDTPLDVPLAELPHASNEDMAAFLGEVSARLPGKESATRRPRGETARPNVPERDGSGRVVDGRDAWLSTIAYHAVHDVLDTGSAVAATALASVVWDRFKATTDLSRPRSGLTCGYGLQDALKKVRDKLRLHSEERLPVRACKEVEAGHTAPELRVDEARRALDDALAQACERIFEWYDPELPKPCPQIGIRATVGLGKSTAARRHLYRLRQRLIDAGLPSRVAVFTPSHALAEETAAEWRSDGLNVAVLRGYEMQHPQMREPMCRDIDAVRTALRAGLDVSTTVCQDSVGRVCRFHSTCLKQENRREVATADIIVAPYDALFSGFAVDPASIGLLVIDEGCWARAIRDTTGLFVETLAAQPIGRRGGFNARISNASRAADLDAVRHRAMHALIEAGPGSVGKRQLQSAGLTPGDCHLASTLELRRRSDPGLFPGMSKDQRCTANALAAQNEIAGKLAQLFTVMAEMLERDDAQGRLRILPPNHGTGLHEIVITGLASIHQNLRAKPVLYLDATLRSAVARQILPCLEVTEIDAMAPSMRVCLITGRFGKSALCESPLAPSDENARRGRHLSAVVDYVRWLALKVTPGQTLVITFKSCEEAFADIPGVETAHYNAIAGLDGYKAVDQIILVGRPLPNPDDLAKLCGGLLGKEIEGRYYRDLAGVRMRDGSSLGVRVLGHSDPTGDLIRAAVCDDELIQAVGRGRGVNRTSENPLDVHILADVVLPLEHDEVTTWDLVAPNLFQKMVLAGLAVDSPADAAVLHPELFRNAEQAKKQFGRGGFKGQTSYKDPITGMSLKSAAYRRAGRGRGWQRAWWISGSSPVALALMEAKLGPLADWLVDGD